MSSSPEFSSAQLAAARAAAWHQNGAALTTAEAARTWIEKAGLVLFAPRAAAIGAPAPSLVEATLGEAQEAVTAAQSNLARQMVARLTGEGSVVPLTLLGSAGAVPDFLASAKTFSYIFTLLGDKAWKQPPSTSEGAKVSTLALKVYESLTENGAQTATELAANLGREVTEAAILRALHELWATLRVLPQLQLDETATVWELSTKRFAKAIKAGANAGQPSALSALLSLYLAQSILATEEEAVAFLSPLTARSRAREVVHALVSARQLDTVVLEGKTLLYVVGELPEFAAAAVPAAEEGEAAVEEAAPERPKKIGTGRITRFEAAAGSEDKSTFRGRPSASAAGRSVKPPFREGGAKRAFGAKPAYGAARDGSAPTSRGKYSDRSARPDAERRPFRRAESADAKPSFTRPWDEDKRPRRESAEGATEGARPRKPYTPREGKPYAPRTGSASRPAFGERKPYASRSAEGGERKPYERKPYERKPYAPREGAAERPSRSFDGERKSFAPRKPYAPRTAEGGERKPYERKPYQRSAESGERKPYERKTFTPRDGEAPRRPYSPRSAEGERKPFRPRAAEGERTPYTKSGDSFSKFRKPESGARKSFDRPDGDRPRTFSDKPSVQRKPRSFSDKPRTFRRRSAKPRAYGDKAKSFGERKAPGSFSARPRPAFGSKPAGAKPFGAKPFGAKPFGAKPAGKFAGKPAFKAGAKRPFVKREGAPVRPRRPRAEE